MNSLLSLIVTPKQAVALARAGWKSKTAFYAHIESCGKANWLSYKIFHEETCLHTLEIPEAYVPSDCFRLMLPTFEELWKALPAQIDQHGRSITPLPTQIAGADKSYELTMEANRVCYRSAEHGYLCVFYLTDSILDVLVRLFVWVKSFEKPHNQDA